MRRSLCLVAAALALTVPAAAASAATRYVDAQTGADTDPACGIAAPCQTIAYAIANSASNDEIAVDSGSYAESVTLADGRSLAFQDFVAGDGNTPAVIDGGSANAVTVPIAGAGEIAGFTIRSDAAGVRLNGPADVHDNTFDDPDGANAYGVNADFASGVSIHDNTMTDPAPGPTRARVAV